jgi:hypothetical protein
VIGLPHDATADLSNWTLANFSDHLKQDKPAVMVFTPNGTLRRSKNVIPDFANKTKWKWSNTRIFRNGTEIFDALNVLGCKAGDCKSSSLPQAGNCLLYENCEATEYHTLWDLAVSAQQRPAVVWVEHQPTWDYGLPNPFTASVWNAIFVIVFLLCLASWAVWQFSKIDIQTRFAKKLA